MFESLVATLLNRFLGSYIENFDPKQLNIGIWSGDVKLKNLKLRKESLDKFQLPLDVKAGHLGTLTLQIPWSNLKGKPVRVIIEDVYLVASPIIIENYDEEEEKNRELQVKREKIKDLETLEVAQNQSLTDGTSNETFVESLVTKIIDNLQVTIKNIHFRYEDDSVLTEWPYAIGLTLNEFSAVSTNESWEVSFISITQSLTRKLITLKNLSLYMNTNSESVNTEDLEVLLKKLKLDIITDDSDIDLEYLLRPVSGTGRLTINKKGTTETIPHISSQFFFEELGVDLNSSQYRNILWAASKFHWYMKTSKFRKLRPKVSVQENPKEWFRFAANAILNEIHEKNYKWSWEYFAKRRDQRIQYIQLWKQKLLNGNLGIEEQKELSDLEDELEFEDIKFYRSLTRKEVRKESKNINPATKRSPVNENKEGSGGGWFSWWNGSETKNTSQAKENLDLVLNQTQLNALYDTIDYDQNKSLADAIDVPRDRVKFELSATLDRGGVSIKKNSDDPNLAEIIFEGCTAEFKQRPDSFLASFQLQEFGVKDGTNTSLYKHFISVNNVHSKLHEFDETKESPFFQVLFENNPLYGHADSSLVARLKSMAIFYNPSFINEVAIFFKPPKMHLDTIGAIMNAAEATVEGITSQTRIGLQYALEEHKTIDVKLDLQAPLIILPLDPMSSKSPVAILDAGHISVTSNLVEKSKIEEVRSKESYSDEDWEALNTLMYDEFSLHLQDAQFLVGPSIKATMEQLHSNDETDLAYILDKLSINLLLGISILPEAYNLPRIKVRGEVPDIKLSINDFQYKTIMKLIDLAIPSFEVEESENSSIFNTYTSGGSNYSQSMLDTSSNEKNTNKSEKEVDLKDSASLTQRLFEFEFKVNSVVISLLRCRSGGVLETVPLVDLIGSSLILSFYKTQNDLKLDLGLKDINIMDHIEESGIPEFQYLISSKIQENLVTGNDKDLFKLKYTRSQRIVEHDNKEIEVFDQDIDIDIATVKFVVSRKSLLSLLNFALNTFTDPIAEYTPADELRHNSSSDNDSSPQRILLKMNLESIICVLNDDGVKLATLELSTANIHGFIVPEEMEFTGKLGSLTLNDEVNTNPDAEDLRKLIKMEGDNLVEFRYKTFDCENNENNYNTLFELKTGSLTINFIEDSISNIIQFSTKFQRMKEIYDKARDAAISQANQIDYGNNIKFDVQIKAPTIIFPLSTNESKLSNMSVYLGELYASNEFISTENVLKNEISSGIRNVHIWSSLILHESVQNIDIVENLDVSFIIDYYEKYLKDTPSSNLAGWMPQIDMKLTEIQLKSIMTIYESIMNVTDISHLDESFDDIELEAENANANISQYLKGSDETNLSKISESNIEETKGTIYPPDHVKVALSFKIPRLSLTIYNKTDGVSDIESKKISTYSLNQSRLTLEIKENGQLSSNVNINSLIVEDVRINNTNKYTEIIPMKDGDDQFRLSAMSNGHMDNKNYTVILNIDNPKVILALDYLFEVKAFFDKGFESNSDDTRRKSIRLDAISDLKAPSNIKETSELISPNIGFSITIKEPSVILLEDPSNTNSIAVVFGIDEVLITSQNIMSIAANNIGMFLCHMNEYHIKEKRIRIIDDFSISFAHDSRGSSNSKFLTNINASIDPLLLRVSLRDIRLALSIFNRASELYEKVVENKSVIDDSDKYKLSDDFKRRLSEYAPSIKSAVSDDRDDLSSIDGTTVYAEDFTANIGGLRFVLIGDVHELPVLDMNVKPFEISAKNWSSELSAECHIETFVNIFNYARSSWEPLIETWPIDFYASKGLKPNKSVIIDIISRKLAEITLSSRSIALMSHVSSLITAEEGLKPRGQDNPYLIINETGYDLEVWIDYKDGNKGNTTKIESNGSLPWSFQSWTEIRENLDANTSVGSLGIKILNSPYEQISNISVVGEGEDLVMLMPPVDNVHTRLSCDVVLREDNIKNVYLRSTVLLKNDTEISLVAQITRKDNQKVEVVLKSNEMRSVGIDDAYSGKIKVKPLIDAAYDWSENEIYWKELLRAGESLRCKSLSSKDMVPYCFQCEAKYDKDEPLAHIYPHMTIVISSPVEIENLLPFDLNYRLYDKTSKKDWKGSIKRGEKTYVHIVALTSLLLLSVQPKDCGYGYSDFAIINSPENSEFSRENSMSVVHEDKQRLQLRIQYPKKISSTNLKVAIFTPYIILNRTGEDLILNERGNQLRSYGKPSTRPVVPNMFSFNKFGDTKNRALLRVGDSTWSAPLSLDAIGQSFDISMQLNGKMAEMNVGISISEGEGKYALTKVINIVPRYIIQNTLNEVIEVNENGTMNTFQAKCNEVLPLFGLRYKSKKNLLLRFENSKVWSSPFAIDDMGQIFVKLYKDGSGQILIKVNILLENGTIFIQLENSNNDWPFSIRNYSESEFYIYQNDPNVNSNGEVVKNDTTYKPIYYKIPPKSVMPYAYDYPNAIIKELIIRSHGRERSVNLAEIGNLKPFRLPATDTLEEAIVDLNVVADGPTCSLIITKYDPMVSLYKLENKSTTNASTQNFEVTVADENYHTRIITKFEGFGISLINTKNQELCYTTLRGLEVRYNESDLYQNLSVKLKWIQIDNQLFGGIFPIVLYPSVIPKSGKEMNNHPSLSGSVCKVKDDSYGVLFIKYATILLQEMTLEIDEDFLFALIEFSKIPGASWNKKHLDILCDSDISLPEPKKLSDASDIYFEALHLQPTLTHLSFVRTERINADELTSQNTLMFFFNVLTMAIGNINDAPIKLNALFIENIRVPLPILSESIQTHYGQSFFYQVHKIIGSADFLGNPVGLFNNLSSGVLDIFYEPYQGFIINDRPQELGIGIAKGGLSFLKKSIFGFSDSVAKITGSMAKGLSVATLDNSFQERRRLNQRRNKPKHALYGFASGANSFFESISSGVTGIATAPIEGANTGGAAGFFKGIGKGFVGLPTKTAIGFFDLASNVSEGIRNTTTVFDAEGLDKVRLPRYISHDKVIRPYSDREAQGQFWLKSIDGGTYMTEQYLAHLLLQGEEMAVLVSYNRIFLFEINTLKTQWIITFDNVKSITVETTGISIKLKKREGPFIPIPEKKSKLFLYNKFRVAVEEFNKHCQVVL